MLSANFDPKRKFVNDWKRDYQFEKGWFLVDLTSVSVVIPTKDRYDELYRAIRSVFEQTFQNWELIVVVDTPDLSQYNTICDQLKEMGLAQIELNSDTAEFNYENRCQVRVIRNLSKSFSGASYARNLGIQRSRASLIAFLDSDDVWLREKLRTQIDFMTKKSLWASHTDYLLKSVTSTKAVKISTKIMRGQSLHQRIAFRQCLIATPTVMFDKDRYNFSNQLFPVGLQLGEDLVAWMRLSAQNPTKFGHLKAPLTQVHTNGNSSRHKTFDESTASYIRREVAILGIKEISPWRMGGAKYIILRILLKRCPVSLKRKLRCIWERLR
jgi:glycosyltransferase involved in cell wall biosynthesis